MALMKKVVRLGMPMDIWEHKSCVAEVGVGDDWATIYYIESSLKGKGHGTELAVEMKKHYEEQGKEFGSSVALSSAMKHILLKLNIKEYT